MTWSFSVIYPEGCHARRAVSGVSAVQTLDGYASSACTGAQLMCAHCSRTWYHQSVYCITPAGVSRLLMYICKSLRRTGTAQWSVDLLLGVRWFALKV